MYVPWNSSEFIYSRDLCARPRVRAWHWIARGEVNLLSRGCSVNRSTRESIDFDSRIRRINQSDSSLKIPFSKNSFLEKCLSLKISFSQNVLLSKSQSRKCPSRKISSFLKSLSQKFLLVREGFSFLYVRSVGVWVCGGGTGQRFWMCFDMPQVTFLISLGISSKN